MATADFNLIPYYYYYYYYYYTLYVLIISSSRFKGIKLRYRWYVISQSNILFKMSVTICIEIYNEMSKDLASITILPHAQRCRKW